MEKLTRHIDLNNKIKMLMRTHELQKFPYEFIFNLGMEHPQFKFTIEIQDSDTYIDSNGQKWKKIK